MSPVGDAARRFRAATARCRRAWRPLVILVLALGAFTAWAQPAAQRLQGESPRDSSALRREAMVEDQIRRRGITQEKLLSVMSLVPRHLFVPEFLRQRAYDDAPVALERPGDSLPQAYVSARMISLLELRGGEKVLEIGTGSGYDSALLSRLAAKVFTVEIDPRTAELAKKTLRELGYHNVQVRVGDGYRGWPEAAPFDGILVTAAPKTVPEPLFEQLAIGGRMVVAVGFSLHQDLQVITKKADGTRETRRVSLISLAPMTGEVEQKRER